LVAVNLVRELSRLEPEWELVLLTSSSSHAELAELDGSNVRRVRVLNDDAMTGGTTSSPTRRLGAFAREAFEVVPTRVRVRARETVWRLRHSQRNTRVIDSLGTQVLLCPFTASPFWQPNVPLVVIVHDLQHVAYPDFFRGEQQLNRERHLRDAAKRAARVVCVSDFVRRAFQAYTAIEHERVVTIHHGLMHEFHTLSDSTSLFDNVRLRPGGYLLYPANFWPHKNHRVLFDALGRYRALRPDSDLKLVCTGAPNEVMRALEADANSRLGTNTALFPGHVNAAHFQALLDNCTALVYPSLYEGFGMPALEAMARGKPLLCSRAASLPEVAGQAAHYFDPTDAADIARAIAWLSDDPTAVAANVECGRTRARGFGDAADMARKYRDLLGEIVAAQ
jgi:glycosyltransferase involved in cell wall biosynthesis